MQYNTDKKHLGQTKVFKVKSKNKKLIPKNIRLLLPCDISSSSEGLVGKASSIGRQKNSEKW